MLIAPNVSYCFCDPHNPTYNAANAADRGFKLFTYPGACPFDLVKYGMAKGLFPDLQLPFPGGKKYCMITGTSLRGTSCVNITKENESNYEL